MSLWADIQPESRRRILLAAVEAFSLQGYHPTSTREIAQRAGMSPAAMYVHYGSKAELLFEICRTALAALVADVTAAVEARDTPPTRLEAFMESLVAWVASNLALTRVIEAGIVDLDAEHLAEVRGIQNQLVAFVRDELRAGADRGAFTVGDAEATTRALVSMGVDVARWWAADAPQPDVDALGAAYAALALRMVGAAPDSRVSPSDRSACAQGRRQGRHR